MDATDKRLAYEVDHCHSNILAALADKARDDGNELLASGYDWLRNNRCWPYERMEVKRRRRPPCDYRVPLGWAWGAYWGDSQLESATLPFDSAYWGFAPDTARFASASEALEFASAAVAKWYAKTKGDPCNWCDGIGTEDPPDNNHTCPQCRGSGQHTPKRTRKANQPTTLTNLQWETPNANQTT